MNLHQHPQFSWWISPPYCRYSIWGNPSDDKQVQVSTVVDYPCPHFCVVTAPKHFEQSIMYCLRLCILLHLHVFAFKVELKQIPLGTCRWECMYTSFMSRSFTNLWTRYNLLTLALPKLSEHSGFKVLGLTNPLLSTLLTTGQETLAKPIIKNHTELLQINWVLSANLSGLLDCYSAIVLITVNFTVQWFLVAALRLMSKIWLLAGGDVVEEKFAANHVSSSLPPCKHLICLVDHQLPLSNRGR